MTLPLLIRMGGLTNAFYSFDLASRRAFDIEGLGEKQIINFVERGWLYVADSSRDRLVVLNMQRLAPQLRECGIRLEPCACSAP